MVTRLWWGVIFIVIVGLLILGTPYTISAYYLDKGIRSLNNQDNQIAIQHLETALNFEPNNVKAYRFLAKAYRQSNEPKKALAVAQQALSFAPDNPLIHLELGDLYDRLSDSEQAIAHYEAGSASRRLPQLTFNYLQVADRLWDGGRYAEAVAIWRDKVRSSSYGDLYANWQLAQYYVADEEMAEAYRDGIRYFPLESISLSSDRRLDKYQTQALLGVVADGLWTREKLLNVVAYRVWQDQSQVTEDWLQSLLIENSTDADLRFYLGEMYHRRGDWRQAEASYQLVVNLDPGYAQAYLRLGMVSESASQEDDEPANNQSLEKAVNWYEHYHHLAPEDLFGLKKLAELYEVLDKPEVAALQEEFKARTDDRQAIADLLGENVSAVSLGQNSLFNGGFENWQLQKPEGWLWYDNNIAGIRNRGIFIGGQDALATMEGQFSGRVDGLWLQYNEDKSPGRSGWDYVYPSMLGLWQNTDYYALSFFYRTERLSDQAVEIRLFSNSGQNLPNTNRTWQYQTILLRRTDLEDGMIRPLFRIYNTPGHFWVDGVRVRPVKVNQ